MAVHEVLHGFTSYMGGSTNSLQLCGRAEHWQCLQPQVGHQAGEPASEVLAASRAQAGVSFQSVTPYFDIFVCLKSEKLG